METAVTEIQKILVCQSLLHHSKDGLKIDISSLMDTMNGSYLTKALEQTLDKTNIISYISEIVPIQHDSSSQSLTLSIPCVKTISTLLKQSLDIYKDELISDIENYETAYAKKRKEIDLIEAGDSDIMLDEEFRPAPGWLAEGKDAELNESQDAESTAGKLETSPAVIESKDEFLDANESPEVIAQPEEAIVEGKEEIKEIEKPAESEEPKEDEREVQANEEEISDTNSPEIKEEPIPKTPTREGESDLDEPSAPTPEPVTPPSQRTSPSASPIIKEEDVKLPRKRSKSPMVPNKRFQSIANPLISNIASHRYASAFLAPVNENDAPDYYSLVLEPTDLKSIRKAIKDGEIIDTLSLEREIMLMFANCLMYNKEGTDLVDLTKSMKDDVDNMISLFKEAERDAIRD